MKSFTLVETIVAIFIFAILMVIVSALVVTLYRTESYQWQQSLAISEARRGMDIMIKEIREAREGENGTYPIEYAGDKEFIFYSDIDNDGEVERVRYFLGEINSETLIQECESSQKGGTCSVTFSDFLSENLQTAQVTVSVRGDLGQGNEFVEIFGDSQGLATSCQTGCTNCSLNWEGTQVVDVTSLASDNSISFLADASWKVDPICPYAFQARFELSFTEELPGTELKKGVIDPQGYPPTYPQDQEKITTITPYVRNAPPIFEYFDQNGNKIDDYPARLSDTKVMKVFLVVNIDPNRPPTEYQLESFVQLRNLKEE
jgi:type II secretory pathway pseudopilin PulG